jgi:hypothetical protein
MKRLRGSGTKWVSRDGKRVKDGGPSSHIGHAVKELADRKKKRKLAKKARKVTQGRG